MVNSIEKKANTSKEPPSMVEQAYNIANKTITTKITSKDLSVICFCYRITLVLYSVLQICLQEFHIHNHSKKEEEEFHIHDIKLLSFGD